MIDEKYNAFPTIYTNNNKNNKLDPYFITVFEYRSNPTKFDYDTTKRKKKTKNQTKKYKQKQQK